MKFLNILIALFLISGCVSRDKSGAELTSRWIGREFDEFVSLNGAPGKKFVLQNKDVSYNWESYQKINKEPYKCRATILVDSKGLVRQITVINDSLGYWGLSYCAEVLR